MSVAVFRLVVLPCFVAWLVPLCVKRSPVPLPMRIEPVRWAALLRLTQMIICVNPFYNRGFTILTQFYSDSPILDFRNNGMLSLGA